ncbi:MAG: ABC transporter ATP-binding protein, partial [Desulfuromonas sp.]
MNRLYDLKNIKDTYGGTFALQIKTLSLQAERLYAITGHNGSGKSTLLKLLALLRRPVAGELRVSEQLVEPSVETALRRAFTLVEQTPYLFNGTVEQNVGYGLKLRGVDREVRKQSIDRALNRVGMTGYAGNRRGQLSRGQVQRVALARALALKPEVLLLDEPTASGDREFKSLFTDLLQSLVADRITVIMATHDLGLARDLGAELLLLEQGRLIDSSCRKSESAHAASIDKHHGPV